MRLEGGHLVWESAVGHDDVLQFSGPFARAGDDVLDFVDHEVDPEFVAKVFSEDVCAEVLHQPPGSQWRHRVQELRVANWRLFQHWIMKHLSCHGFQREHRAHHVLCDGLQGRRERQLHPVTILHEAFCCSRLPSAGFATQQQDVHGTVPWNVGRNNTSTRVDVLLHYTHRGIRTHEHEHPTPGNTYASLKNPGHLFVCGIVIDHHDAPIIIIIKVLAQNLQQGLKSIFVDGGALFVRFIQIQGDAR